MHRCRPPRSVCSRRVSVVIEGSLHQCLLWDDLSCGFASCSQRHQRCAGGRPVSQPSLRAYASAIAGQQARKPDLTLRYGQVIALARIFFLCAEQLFVAAAAHLSELFGSLGCLPEEPLFLSGSIAEALQERIAAGMHKVPQVPQARALEGCRFVSCSAAPLEWPEG